MSNLITKDGDFLDEIISERTVKNPEFPALMVAAAKRRNESRAKTVGDSPAAQLLMKILAQEENGRYQSKVLRSIQHACYCFKSCRSIKDRKFQGIVFENLYKNLRLSIRQFNRPKLINDLAESVLVHHARKYRDIYNIRPVGEYL